VWLYAGSGRKACPPNHGFAYRRRGIAPQGRSLRENGGRETQGSAPQILMQV